MATIQPMTDDLFRVGLVNVTSDLYRVIVVESKKTFGKFTRSVSKEKLEEMIHLICAARGYNGMSVIARKALRFPMFIEGIDPVLGRAVVRISMPVVGTTRDHEEIWKRLLEITGAVPNAWIADGDLFASVALPPECAVLYDGIREGKRSFSLAPRPKGEI